MRHISENGDTSNGGNVVYPRADDETGDTLSRKGACKLARRLQEHWHRRGYTAARFWVEPITERFGKLGTHEIHRVVCNFKNGLPPSHG